MKKVFLGIMVTLTALFIPQLANAEETGAIAKIGDNEYTSLQAAVNAAEEGTVIEITRDGETGGLMIVEANPKNVTIDFKGHTLTLAEPLVGSTGTESQNIHIEKGSKVVFKNGTLKASPSSSMFIQNYADLTMTDMVIDAREVTSTIASYYTISNNNGSLLLNGNTSVYAPSTADREGKKNFAMDVYYYTPGYPDGVKVVVDTTGTMIGDIEVASAEATSKSTLNIKNVNLQGNLVISEGLESNVTINGGSFTDENAENLVVKEEGKDTYKIEVAENTYAYVNASEEELIKKPVIGSLVEDDIDATVKENFSKVLTDNSYTLATYYEIIVETYVSYNGNAYFLGMASETGNPVEMVLDIPENLEPVKEGLTRKYYVIRNHNGESTVLDATDNGDGTITFASDQFSTYALVYQDIEVPNTYDGLAVSVIAGVLAFVGLIFVVCSLKKTQKN